MARWPENDSPRRGKLEELARAFAAAEPAVRDAPAAGLSTVEGRGG